MATFAQLYEAHAMHSRSLAEISSDRTLRNLCPGWWKPEGRILTAAEQSQRVRDFHVNRQEYDRNFKDDAEKSRAEQYVKFRKSAKAQTADEKRARQRKSEHKYLAKMNDEDRRAFYRARYYRRKAALAAKGQKP